MSTFEIMIAGLVIAAIVGQAWLVTSSRRRIERRINEEVRKAFQQRERLIEQEFEKQIGDRK